MNAWKLALLAVAISIVALGVVAYAQQTVYVNGSYVVLLPNTTMSSLLEWLLNQTNAPVPQSGILIPVSDLPNVTAVTGYTTWYVYMNLNYTYITANWVTSNMPSGTTATYTPSNATLKFTVPSGVTATNAKATVNFTLGPWNYIIPNSVYGYEENYGTYPVLWLPLTIWDKASGTYNFSITAFMTFPNGTTKQVPVMTPNGYPADIQIFLNPWGNSYDYYVFTYQNAVKLNKSLGILVTRTTSYVDVGIPIGALLYSEVPVNITLVVTAFYNATTSGTMGISLYMPVTSIKAGTYTYYYTSESNYAYIADVYAGFDGYDVTSPLYLPNFTCYINIVRQLFVCYEGNHFVPVAFRGGLLTGNFSGSGGLYPLFIEYPYYFYRFGGGYNYVLYPNGTSVWMYDNIGGYQSWFQTAPAYVSTAVGSRLVEAVGVYWSYPSVPNYQWKAMYTELSYTWSYTTSGLFTNTTIGTLFYGNYTQSDLVNRLTFSVTAPAFSMSLARVGAGGYTFWANAVNINGSGSITLGNNLTSGYSLVIVLNPSTLNIINMYKVPVGSSVSINLSPGNYLVINMIPTQYNATEANALNLTQNPQYYPFAWSFDPAAQVYYISVTQVTQVTQNATINLNATAYPLLLNVTVYTPSGAVNSSIVNMTGPTQLVVPQYSNVTINVFSIPRGYNLNYTQWTVNFTSVTGTVNYTYYLLPIIPINVTFLSLCPNYTLSIFNTFNGTTSTLQLGFKNTVVLYYNMTDTYSVINYSSICKAVGALSGEVTPLFNGQFVVIPLVNPNATVVPWYGYSIPQQYLNELLSAPLGSQLLILPPPPRTVDYYQAIPIVPLPWSNATGFINADMGNFFNGYVNTPNGVVYIENSASEDLYLYPNMYNPWSSIPLNCLWINGHEYCSEPFPTYNVQDYGSITVKPGPYLPPDSAFLIYTTSGFPLPIQHYSNYYLSDWNSISSLGDLSAVTPYYVPAQMVVKYSSATPITIPLTVATLTINMNISVVGGSLSIFSGIVNSCKIPSGAELIYETAGPNGSEYQLYQLGNEFYECFLNLPHNGGIFSFQANDTVTVAVTLSHVVGSIVPIQFPINVTSNIVLATVPLPLPSTPPPYGTIHIIATVTASRTTVSVVGTAIINITRGIDIASGSDANIPSNAWDVFVVPINITARVANLPTPETMITNTTPVPVGLSVPLPISLVAAASSSPPAMYIGGSATVSSYVEKLIHGGVPITCGSSCVPWTMGGVDIGEYMGVTFSGTLGFYYVMPNMAPGYNVTINALVGGLWSWARQPTAMPGAEGFGLIRGGFPYPMPPTLYFICNPSTGQCTYGVNKTVMIFNYPLIANNYTYGINISLPPLYVSNWTVVNNVPNMYGTVMIPAAFGNSPNSVITATYTDTIPLSFNNLAAVQVGETVQGLFNGTFTAIYKYGPYTYIVRLTATPTSTTGTTFSVTVYATRVLLVNGEVVLENTTRLTLTNIPFPYSGFSINIYGLPPLFMFSQLEPPTQEMYVYDPTFKLFVPWDIEPMMVDSKILGGDYGTLQVTYQLTEYPVTVKFNRTLIYSWYQGPNAYNYTVTQYLFPAVLITPSIYALVNATTQPVNAFYAAGYININGFNPSYIYAYVTLSPINYILSLLVAQDNISGYTMAPTWGWSGMLFVPYFYASLPVDYLNGFAVPLIGLHIPPHGYPLMPVWPSYGVFYQQPFSIEAIYQGNTVPFATFALPNTPEFPLFDIPEYLVNIEQYTSGAPIYELAPSDFYTMYNIVKSWSNDRLYALLLPDIYESHVNSFWINYTIYVSMPSFVNITITHLNGTDLICIKSNPISQITPAYWYPMNISEVVPSLDVGVYYLLGNLSASIVYKPNALPLINPNGFFVPLLQVVNVTSLCFVPTLNGTFFIVAYIPPQSLLKSVYIKMNMTQLSVLYVSWHTVIMLSSISNASGVSYTPVLIVLTNKSFAMDYRDVVNPMSPDVLWLNIVQPQYVTVTTNLTALKLLFPNATITPFSVNITSNGTLTSSGTGVIIVNASSTSPTPITYSGGASTSIMQVQYMAMYFAGVTAKVVLNTVGTDLTPLVARLGLPLFSVNGTASTSPITVLALSKATNTIRICIPPVIGPIVVANSGCFNATIAANETLPLVIYVRLPVNLNITAINNNGKLVVKVTGTDFFGNPVVYYPINVTVYLSNGTVTYTAVIRNGVVEVSTGLPYQSNTLVTAQGNGTGAYLPASTSTYVPVTSVSTLPPWLAYIGSIWWLLLLVILLVVLIVVMIILERKRAKKRRVRAYTPYWV